MALSDETMLQAYDTLGLPQSMNLTGDRLVRHMIWQFEVMIYRCVAIHTKLEYERTYKLLDSRTAMAIGLANSMGILPTTKQRGRLYTERDRAIGRLNSMRASRLHGNNSWRFDYADIISHISNPAPNDATDTFDLIDAVIAAEQELSQ